MIYVVRSWPRLSQTFIVNEVLALERLGVELEIFAMTRSGERLVQPQVAAVRAPVTYLDDGARAVGWRGGDRATLATRALWPYLRTTAFAHRHPELSRGYATASTRQCLEHAVRIGARVHRAHEDGVRIRHVHAHFAHDPALVALLASRLTGLPYTVTAHARDLYQIPRSNLVVRAASAASVLTCCRVNGEYLHQVLPEALAGRVRVVHHGVDIKRFSPTATDATADVPRLVSIGRMVEKKGFPDLLVACAKVRSSGIAFRLTIYGDGPMRPALERLRDDLGLQAVVDLPGERGSDEVVAALQAADAFVLTPFVTQDGDRDGVPNVVVEAMACALPVVATAVGGIPEVVQHRRNGLLAPARDVDAIAQHLITLLSDAGARARMGTAARKTVESHFDVDQAAAQLAELFAVGGGSR